MRLRLLLITFAFIFVVLPVGSASKACMDCNPPILGHAYGATLAATERAAIRDCESMCNSNFCSFHAAQGGSCEGATVPAENATCQVSSANYDNGEWHVDATGDCWCTNPGEWDPMMAMLRILFPKTKGR